MQPEADHLQTTAHRADALYSQLHLLDPKERKPRRILEKTRAAHLAILKALGFSIKDDRVLQLN